MNNLINITNQKGNLVVSSREVAEHFEKEHNDTKKRIREIEKDMGEKSHNYIFISNYVDSMNRTQEEYLLTRDGFTLLAMGFTGKKALDWKLKYIEAFNQMEKEILTTKKLSPMEQLKLQYEVLDEHDERISYLENNMTIDYGQQLVLQNKAKSKVVKSLGGINSPAYANTHVRNKAFSSIWRDFKDYIAVGSYKDTSRKEFDKALNYLDGWKMEGKLLREVEECNYQLSI